MLDWINPVTNLAVFLVTIGGTVGTLVWALSVQFTKQNARFDAKIEKLQQAILDKLEYHERHDDRRFSEVKDDIFGIQLRNAAIDGEVFVQRARARNKAIAERNAEIAEQKDKE